MTIYYPQLNGQMKQMNQEIKKYLRKFINHNQNDWPDYLSMLEFLYNIKKADDRIFIPYQIIYGEIPAVTVKKRMIEIQIRKRLQKKVRKITQEYPVKEYKEND